MSIRIPGTALDTFGQIAVPMKSRAQFVVRLDDVTGSVYVASLMARTYVAASWRANVTEARTFTFNIAHAVARRNRGIVVQL